MTTLLPESGAEAPSPTARSRRGLRRLLLALIGVLVIVLAVASAWLLTYQPLVSGGVGGVDADAVEVYDNALGSEYRIVAPEAGDTIGMWLELRNDGPLGITIIEVGQPFNPDGIVDPMSSSEATGPGRLELMVYPPGRPTQVSEPFSIAPDMAYEAFLSFDVADCATVPDASGSRSWTATVPVTYRVLGLTRTVDLDIGYVISLEAEPSCPMR